MGNMDEATDLKIKNLDKDITEINQKLEELPDTIAARLNENIELKISLAKKDLEMKFYKAIAGVTGGLILEFVIMMLDIFLKQKV